MLVRVCLGRLWMCVEVCQVWNRIDSGRFDSQNTTGNTVVRDCDRKIQTPIK